MLEDENTQRYGVHDTVSGLHDGLCQYIEAQYHVKDEGLLAERHALLKEAGVIAQKAFVEATPVYEFGEPYSKLRIPQRAKEILTQIAAVRDDSGLYPEPYRHQADALEAFLGDDREELVVATGTGSGKTESFLMPIVASLALESAEREPTCSLPGCRAILLYPMNALVNDQLARIRRLLGNTRVNKLVSEGRGRPVRFGSYTGRTPYPGPRKSNRDRTRIAPLFDDFYNRVETKPELKQQLQRLGRWPSKDLVGFYNADASQTKTYATGKKAGQDYNASNWKYRLLTQPGDRELMTRHEMQAQCPDILITNYSMLEYMLMRPIERKIFEQTSTWLAADVRNELILVLDEAHMYRGAGGAEVALLIRRLIARLGIPRSRVRCILTSASLGDGPDAIRDAEQFAIDLTGSSDTPKSRFRVVTGTKEKRPAGRPATTSEVAAFCSLTIDTLSNLASSATEAGVQIRRLSQQLGWPAPPEDADEVRDYLFSHLSAFGPVNLLINQVSGRATALETLTQLLAPEASLEESQKVLDSLLSLCSQARRAKDGRVLLPTRLHLFHRGLPGLYACSDPNCSERRARTDAPPVLGRFHTKPLLSCTCRSKARVYDFYTHRDCGAAFITGWVDEKCNFVWHEPNIGLSRNQNRKLYPIEMLVEPKAHTSSRHCDAWLHFETGLLARSRPADLTGYRHVRIPDKDVNVEGELRFDNCPVCCQRTRVTKTDPSKIMDHVTKGEAPFATLVRAQMFHQPASREEDQVHPNAGRKVLVFSDGRQKAARLARDMPRDMELDLFRQAIAVATEMLGQISRESKPTKTILYLAFLAALSKSNVSMFDGVDAVTLDQHLESFKHNFDADLSVALSENYQPGDPPWRYRLALLKLLCSSYYSLNGTTVGFVEPTKHALNKVRTTVSEQGVTLSVDQTQALAVAWVDGLLGEFAFDIDFPPALREQAYGFWRQNWGSKGQFRQQFRKALTTGLGFGEAGVKKLEQAMASHLAVGTDGLFLNPNMLKVSVDLSRRWVQCADCTSLMPFDLDGACLSCGSRDTQSLDPATDPYMRARKSFWRQPVSAALEPNAILRNMAVEEHTAQLSGRDYRNVHSTTELHELRFQDILLSDGDRPVDVLSCTTTMEVGIDIGSLVAVALRNVPPQRENYQQRAGRAGRRGSSVSSVVAFSQNGPHDSFYFHNAAQMVSGPPRTPELKIDNPKIAIRHVHAFLMQTFFQDTSVHGAWEGTGTAMLQKALGRTVDFFTGTTDGPNLSSFAQWLEEHVLASPHHLAKHVSAWLPPGLNIEGDSLLAWVLKVSAAYLETLRELEVAVRADLVSETGDRGDEEGDDEDGDEENYQTLEHEDLLEFLFFHQLLPTYAFPTSLCSFLVEEWKRNSKGRWEIKLEQQPQLSTGQALSEYAPGRLVVINKKTYRSGGVFSSAPSPEGNRAEKLFEPDNAKWLVICDACSFVQDPYGGGKPLAACPVCASNLRTQLMIQPEVFGPEKARALSEEDREQDITFATMAQYPQPTDSETFDFRSSGTYLRYAHATNKRLLTLNKGQTRDGEPQGFSVCNKCGCAEVFDKPKSGKHIRPYLLPSSAANNTCDGEFVQTFLGYDFQTDLLLLRLQVKAPLITDVGNPLVVRVLESAAHSLAEALRLAASRHRQLDLDPTEFGAGHRILAIDAEGSVSLDVYLYDTLSGGAGYAELAAKYFDEIARETLALLEGCTCDTSCTECLDHFHNQHLKGQLDRRLAASLLRYGIDGALPKSEAPEAQGVLLHALASSLRLDAITCSFAETESGQTIPLTAKLGAKKLLINVFPSLLAVSDVALECKPGDSTYHLTELTLRSDLPAVHAEIRRRLRA
ncbi:DEAD/DEAH box helicase [Burkholderia pseudomallei]|uniref:DEAD/DEAH box helicase n=1 Tax=Burkholderia pseudomallei TaxID=28450 RepID=UPI001AD77FCD|nr:DEAD/DEAH box helicase [Burkholderia pseudomallei]MBO7822129.1 DEAD/DEAH box helicase [Burkholderia pseudomallei]